jgi:predicted TIM-barrel fold metal-dependent hydrolase
VEPYIDAHSHIWTPDVAHYPLGNGFNVEDMKPPSFTAEELLATCRPCGVGRVNPIQMSFYVRQPLLPMSSQSQYALIIHTC